MNKTHHYKIHANWTGNLGTGTSSYRAYGRDHDVNAPGKASTLLCSSDAAFRGDASRYSPEDLLVASLSACHMLSMLHVCSDAGIVVTAYSDHAEGTMRQNPDGSGEFTQVILHPEIMLQDISRAGELDHLHHKAHELCFIARSVNFPVEVQPVAAK